MSGMNWLQKQRKSDLVELANIVDLPHYDSYKKAELELALDGYLTARAAEFSTHPDVAPYYQPQTRSKTAASPVKREISHDDGYRSLRMPRRRLTRMADEILAATDDDDVSPRVRSAAVVNPAQSTAIIATPTPVRAAALGQRIRLPATPADVARVVDRSTIAVRARVATAIDDSGIPAYTSAARTALSTVTAVLFAVSAFELWGIRKALLPDCYAFTVPAVSVLGTRDWPVSLPNMFILLTSSFWSPAFVWAVTAVVVPCIAGYFCNMTSVRRGDMLPPRRGGSGGGGGGGGDDTALEHVVIDPLVFSISKALLSFVVYGQGVTFCGWLGESAILRLDDAVYGGWKGMLVGCAITGLMSMYSAVLGN